MSTQLLDPSTIKPTTPLPVEPEDAEYIAGLYERKAVADKAAADLTDLARAEKAQPHDRGAGAAGQGVGGRRRHAGDDPPPPGDAGARALGRGAGRGDAEARGVAEAR